MIDDLNTALVRARYSDLAREAASARLLRAAAGCKPSALREKAEHVVARLRHGQVRTSTC